MAKSKEIDWQAIKTMTEDQQQQVYAKLAKRANQRFRDIQEKSKLHSHAVDKAVEWLMETYGRTTFKQTKNIQGVELKDNLRHLEEFYTSKSSSAKGIKDIQKQRVTTFKEKFEPEDQKRFNKIMKDPASKAKFFEFLKSKQFKQLTKDIDSDQLIEDFTKAMDEGFSLDDIMKQYEVFQTTEMTFEQVAERRKYLIDNGLMLH